MKMHPRTGLEVGIFLGHALICEHFIRSSTTRSVTENSSSVRMLLLADSHILGPQRRHWIDILWSDWGLEKAITSAMWVHEPDVVVLNGDVFDEVRVRERACAT
jgi:hypothetical protein